MKADSLHELHTAAINTLCPDIKPANADADFGTCYGPDCQMWREKKARGFDQETQVPFDYYIGWCGRGGQPGDENDFRKKTYTELHSLPPGTTASKGCPGGQALKESQCLELDILPQKR